MGISNSLWEENNTTTGIFMKSFREKGKGLGKVNNATNIASKYGK